MGIRGNKFNGQHHAVGHWSNPWRRVELDQTGAKARVLLQDKLVTKGKWVDLFLPVSSSTAGVVACTCVKDTTDSADRTCLSCYGTHYAPGFLKFLHSTLFWSSAESSSFTLTGVEVSTTKKAHVFSLSSGTLSGTIETTDKAYTNPNDLDWDVKFEAYRRDAGHTFTLEFSTDGGGGWTAIALTEVTDGFGFEGTIPGAMISGTGSIRMRITMTRASSTDRTPYSEIVRIRRTLTENVNTRLQKRRADFVPGSILILRPWTQQQDMVEPGRGHIVQHVGDRAWTSPLDFFDLSLTHDTPPCKVDNTQGPHPFYEYTSGLQLGDRYALTKFYYNEQFGPFTHQYFDDRRAQDGEHYHLIW